MPVVLVTGGYDHKIRFWEATNGACARTLTFGESQVNCLQISADKSLLVAFWYFAKLRTIHGIMKH